MSLRGTIANDTFIVLNEEDNAEEVTVYPDGNPLKAFTATAVVLREAEQGRNEIWGEGQRVEDERGKKIRRTVRLRMLSSINLDDTRKDRIKLANGTVVFVKRIDGRGSTSGFMIVRGVYSDKVYVGKNMKTG